MSLSPFLHHWALLFTPYQSLSCFRTILNGLAHLILYQSLTAHRMVYLLYLIIVLYALQNLYLWAFLPPPLDRLRLGDPVSLVLHLDAYYLVLVALASMLAYFIKVLCFDMKPAFFQLLEDTLFRDTHRTLSGVAYGRLTEQQTARRLSLLLVNLLHVFIVFIDVIFLYLLYSLLITAIQSPVELLGSPLDTPLTFSWNVLCLFLATWTSCTCIGLYAKVYINISAISAGCLSVLFRRLRHSETLLADYRRKERIFSWAPFRQYLAYSGQTFSILFACNAIGGRLFFAFLLAHMPISAWALVQIALGDLAQRSIIVLGFISAHELIGSVLLHWVVAKLTKRLHAPSKTLLTLNAATCHRVGNFRARLLLHHAIVRLHTKAQYGITYGSVGGLITFGSFAKCMLLYMKLLMYAYKLICYN